jgi:hypothetical protein
MVIILVAINLVGEGIEKAIPCKGAKSVGPVFRESLWWAWKELRTVPLDIRGVETVCCKQRKLIRGSTHGGRGNGTKGEAEEMVEDCIKVKKEGK